MLTFRSDPRTFTKSPSTTGGAEVQKEKNPYLNISFHPDLIAPDELVAEQTMNDEELHQMGEEFLEAYEDIELTGEDQ